MKVTIMWPHMFTLISRHSFVSSGSTKKFDFSCTLLISTYPVIEGDTLVLHQMIFDFFHTYFSNNDLHLLPPLTSMSDNRPPSHIYILSNVIFTNRGKLNNLIVGWGDSPCLLSVHWVAAD